MKALTSKEGLKVGFAGVLSGHIDASYEELVEAIGEPTFTGGDQHKINFEWLVNYKGKYFSIYDWKTPRSIVLSEAQFNWNVGGDKGAHEFIVALMLRLDLIRAQKEVSTSSSAFRSPDATEDEREFYRSARSKAISNRDSIQAKVDSLNLF